MTWWTAKSWGWLQAALLALGIVLPFCVPGKVDAGCGNHDLSFSEQPLPPSTVRKATPRGILRSQTLTSQLERDLKYVWKRIWISTPPAPCGSCPFGPGSSKPCDGPSCSGDAPPTSLPVPASALERNESATLAGARREPRIDSLPRGSEVDCRFHPSSCLDAIFHPPRSV
jgi:hypothetical protein